MIKHIPVKRYHHQMSKSARVPRQKKPRKPAKVMTQTRAVSAPVAKQVIVGYREPKFKGGSRPGCVRVEKEEFISDVILPADEEFSLPINLIVNPGNPICFPWLSIFAAAYESYRFHRLTFHYRPQAPTTSNGWVSISLDYDPDDQIPVSKVEALEMEETVRGAPWEIFHHVSTLKNLQKRKSYFVRDPALSLVAPGSEFAAMQTDNTLYDVARLLVCGGIVGNSNLTAGELWVTYDVEFETPQLFGDQDLVVPGKMVRIQSNVDDLTITADKIFGDDPIVSDFSDPSWVWSYTEDENDTFFRLSLLEGIWRPYLVMTPGAISYFTTDVGHGYNFAKILQVRVNDGPWTDFINGFVGVIGTGIDAQVVEVSRDLYSSVLLRPFYPGDTIDIRPGDQYSPSGGDDNWFFLVLRMFNMPVFSTIGMDPMNNLIRGWITNKKGSRASVHPKSHSSSSSERSKLTKIVEKKKLIDIHCCAKKHNDTRKSHSMNGNPLVPVSTSRASCAPTPPVCVTDASITLNPLKKPLSKQQEVVPSNQLLGTDNGTLQPQLSYDRFVALCTEWLTSDVETEEAKRSIFEAYGILDKSAIEEYERRIRSRLTTFHSITKAV